MATTQNQKKKMTKVWTSGLTTQEKLEFLKAYFDSPLDKVPFWKLYKAVKRLNSHFFIIIFNGKS
ncbi:MAG: hypothetical protein ACFFDN_47565 [Candidatus Hodarchaeota archaeon]